MMKKNCFNFKKAMTSAMMLLSMSMTMTSCQDFWDDLLGTPDAPPTETPSEPEDDTSVTPSPDGITVTVEKISDITALLNQIKSDIASKEGQEFVVTIVSNGLKATSDDHTISVPKVENSNIHLNFKNSLTTEAPLLVEAAEISSDALVPVPALNNLTITMPESAGLSIEINMPETCVTLKPTESEALGFENIVSTTALDALCIENGITVKNLQAKGGTVVVKDGSKAETYVYAANDDETALRKNEFGVLPVFIPGRAKYSVVTENGSAYPFQNVKFVKGAAKHANIRFGAHGGIAPTIKLTIDEGVTVKSLSNPHVNAIMGEGEGAELILGPDGWSWGGLAGNTIDASLNYVTKMSGITVTIEPSEEKALQDWLAEVGGDVVYSIRDLPGNLENCTFKSNFIEFRESPRITNSVTKCNFEASGKKNWATVWIPAQSAEISSYRFSFTDCNFSEGFKLDYFINNSIIYEYDEDGNPVYYKTPFYSYYDENRKEHFVQNKDEIPEGAEWEELDRLYFQKRTYAEKFTDYKVTFAFKNCQIGGSKLTETSDFILNYHINGEGIDIRYEIDGRTYKAIFDNEDEYHLDEI